MIKKYIEKTSSYKELKSNIFYNNIKNSPQLTSVMEATTAVSLRLKSLVFSMRFGAGGTERERERDTNFLYNIRKTEVDDVCENTHTHTYTHYHAYTGSHRC